MAKSGDIGGPNPTGMSVYELTPVRLYGETRWILAHDFQEATGKAARIVQKLKDKIGSLELKGTIDA